MPVKINIENRNRKRKIDLSKMEKVARGVLKKLRRKNAQLNIVFVSNQKIRAINRKYLDRDCSTDVIAFPGEGDFMGDIAVSSDKAARNASVYGNTYTIEAALYVIHGILHLSGYDDRTKKKGAAMRRREDEILGEVKGLL